MSDYDQSFLATWGIYPKRNGQKRGKSKSFTEWNKLDVEEQRLAYADIRARNNAGGWEFVKDMERYLKHREWEDEWKGQRLSSDPDLIGRMSAITIEQIIDHAMANLALCEHQIQHPWSYFGREVGAFEGAIIPDCKPCGRNQHRVTSAEIPA